MALHGEVKQESHHTAIDASPIAQAIIKLMENRTVWQGSAQELLNELNRIETNDAIKRAKSWVTTSVWMGRTLTRIAPDLRAVGIDINRDGRKANSTWIVIEKIANLPTLPTLPTQTILHKGSSSVGNSVGNSNLPTLPTQTILHKGSSSVGNNVGNSNLLTSPKPLHSKDYVGNAGNVGKNSPFSSKGDQPDDDWTGNDLNNGYLSGHGADSQLSLLPDELVDPESNKIPNHYLLEDGDQDEF